MIDYHLHTSFSIDCEAPMESMVKAAVHAGINELCFTEHLDIMQPGEIDFDFAAYRKEFLKLQKANPKLNMRFGIEAGICSDTLEDTKQIIESQPFDFVIGSQHLIFGLDAYEQELWQRYSKDKIFDEYLRLCIVSARSCDFYDVFGHIGYVGKPCPYPDKLLSYLKYGDAIDTLLKIIIENGKGIEINTSGLKMTPSTMPEMRIAKRFLELGGEIITIGSDAHAPQNVGFKIPQTLRQLKEIGLRYVCAFDNRKPRFITIP